MLDEELLIGLGCVGCRRGAPILFFAKLLEALVRTGHQSAVRVRLDELLI